MNDEFQDREKVIRGVKHEDSPIIVGPQIYHNYVRPHMGLDGKTSADLGGIDVRGQDKWLTLIQNAARKRYASLRIYTVKNQREYYPYMLPETVD
jgi:hypothetical protein